MKSIIKQFSYSVLCTIVLILAVSSGKVAAQILPTQQYPAQPYNYDNTYVSYNDFYQDLSPYGQWIDDPNYGYIWLPDVDYNFRPYYTNGYWVMTEYGNTWVSDYPWGWACFHYGRWLFDSYYGWLWIPGTTWGPAWVCWRYGNESYGWAPLGPNYDFNSGDYSCPNDWWIFIPPQYLYSGNYYRYWYGPRGNRGLIQTTNIINNTYVYNNNTYVSGPQQSQIEQVTHHPVQVYRLDNSPSTTTYVHQNVVKMFRPAEIKPQPIAGNRIAPPNLVSAPRTVNPKPQPVNSHAGTQVTYKNDHQEPKTPIVSPVVNNASQPQPQIKQPNNETQHRADTYPYNTAIPIVEPHVPNTPSELPRPLQQPKPQGPQQPEPVRYEPQQRSNPSPATQHVDPIHYQPSPGGRPQPAPTQRPEPVRPGGKK